MAKKQTWRLGKGGDRGPRIWGEAVERLDEV